MLARLNKILSSVCSSLISCNRSDLIPNQITQKKITGLSDLFGVFEAATVFISAEKIPTVSLIKLMIAASCSFDTTFTDSLEQGQSYGAFSTNTSITDNFKRAERYKRPSVQCDKRDCAQAFAIIRDLLPISECDCEGMRYYSQILDPNYVMPSRKYLKNSVMVPMYHETKTIIKQELQKCESMALTTDAWTSVTKQSYISLTAHFISNDTFELKSFLLEVKFMPKKHTSENLFNEIRDMINEWGIDNKHIIFVSDNASDIKKALCEIGEFEWIGCFVHRLI